MSRYPRVSFTKDTGMSPRESIEGNFLQFTAFEDKRIAWAMVTYGDKPLVHHYIRIFGHVCSIPTRANTLVHEVQVSPIARRSQEADARDSIENILRQHGLADHALAWCFVSRGEVEAETLRVFGTHPSLLVPRAPKKEEIFVSPDGTFILYPPSCNPGIIS